MLNVSPRIRPSWDDVWIAVARTIAQRSKCVRRQACSVIVSKENRIIAVGYNGPPADFVANGLCDQWCPRAMGVGQAGVNDYSNCYTVHGEANALMVCDRSDREGGTIYIVEGSPCFDCAKLVANSGLSRAVVTPPLPQDVNRVQSAIDLLIASNLEVVEYSG